VVCRACKAVLAGQVPRADVGSAPAGPEAGWPSDRLDQIEREEGPPALFPDDVRALYAGGQRIAAHRALVAATRSPVDAARRKPWIDNMRLWMEASRPPTMFTFNGIGTRLYGKDDAGLDGTHVGTLYFVVLYIPVLATSAYLVRPAGWGSWNFYGSTPIPRAGRTRAWIGLGVYVGAFALFLLLSALANL
jgi:hypothetical protein